MPEPGPPSEFLSFPDPPSWERKADQFDRAWRRGEAPDLDAYLPPPGDLHRRAALFDLIEMDLERRLSAGEPARLEEYLARYPELTYSPAELAGLLRTEYRLRRRFQDPVRWSEYRERFPDSLESRGTGLADTLAPPGEESGSWPRLPGFEILARVGGGGMGTVYKARQLGLARIVALKMIKPEVGEGPEIQALLRREAEAVARLRHEHIVQVYEWGEHQGRPYFAMEFVEGGNLQQKLLSGPLSSRQAAEMLETLARAMHHAHEQGVVHRDLKPANVMLTADGRPRISDFGLAKHLENPVSLIQSGAVVGTPPYMAPEQALGRNREVGPRTDVYALGGVLYECVVGRPPFRAATTSETLLQVISEEPVSPRRLNPAIDRDLETIVLTCLHKNPARRYASALALAEDLRRYRHGEPVQARPVGLWEKSRKWAKRQPALAALAAVGAAAALALVGGVVGLIYGVRLQAALEVARTQKAEAESARAEAERLRGSEEVAHQETKDVLSREKRLTYDHQVALASAAWRENRLARMGQLLEDEEHCPRDMRSWDWYYLDHLYHHPDPQAEVLLLEGHATSVLSIAFSHDGRRLASAALDGEVLVWDVPDGKEPRRLKGSNWRGVVLCAAYSPDGRRLVTAEFDALSELKTHQTLGGVAGLLGAPLGQGFFPLLAASLQIPGKPQIGLKASVRLWDAATEEEDKDSAIPCDAAKVWRVAFSPDGRLLALAGENRTVVLWDLKQRQVARTLEGDAAPFHGAAFSPDGTLLAAVSGASKPPGPPWSVPASGANGYGLLASPQGQGPFLAVPSFLMSKLQSWSGAIKMWDVGTGEELPPLEDQMGGFSRVAFSPDGGRLAASSSDGTVSVWDVRTGKRVFTLAGLPPASGPSLGVADVAFSPNGKRLASASWDQRVTVWDADNGQEILSLSPGPGFVQCVAFSPDGRILAAAGQDGAVRLWDAGPLPR